MFSQRLDNFLIQNNLCSKRSAQNFLKNNEIMINEVLQKNHKVKINPEKDIVKINNNELEKIKHFYLMMNKPAGFVCSSVSDRSKVVYELLEKFKNENQKEFEKLHTVGRLDKDTEGLLLFTTNGNFSDFITRKENQIEKTYFVELEKKVLEEEQLLYKEKFEKGIFIPEEKKAKSFTTLPAKIIWLSDTSCNLTIQEGKFHQVRRMFLVMNNFVTYLKRISIGKLNLDESLTQGEYKILSQNEIEKIIL